MGWEEVADAVVRRRSELGMRTREQLVEATGLSRKTLGEIERAERTSYDPATLARVEKALGWPYGSLEAIAAGEPPPTPQLDPLLVEAQRLLAESSSDLQLIHRRGLLADAIERMQRPSLPQMIRDSTDWGDARKAAVLRILGEFVGDLPTYGPADTEPVHDPYIGSRWEYPSDRPDDAYDDWPPAPGLPDPRPFVPVRELGPGVDPDQPGPPSGKSLHKDRAR